MNDSVENKCRHLLFIVCSLLLLSACATTASKKSEIEERVMGRWDKVLSGDLAAAYTYLSPGTRSSVSSMDYQRSILTQRVAWTGARYIRSECEESACKVKLSIDYVVNGAVPGIKSFKGVSEIEESWVLIDGTWYMVPLKL